MNSSTDTLILRDDFEKPRAAGSVGDDPCSTGQVRRVTDVDGVISIDHNALRFGYPRAAGWGRESVAYGPFRRENGLAFAVHLLNGHHSSQALPAPRFSVKSRLGWAVRTLQYELGLIEAPPNPRALHHMPPLKENFAAGWHGSMNPTSPVESGHGFVVHAAGPTNGELWTTAGGSPASVQSNLQNVPLYLVVVLREDGAAFYASSLSGMPAYRYMRPLSIDVRRTDEDLYAVISQGTQGEIGFRVDSRVYGVRIARLSSCDAWYGTAHVADRFGQRAPAVRRKAATGGAWRVAPAPGETGISMASIDPKVPSGLVFLSISSEAQGNTSGLVWRMQDAENCWRLKLEPARICIERVRAGQVELMKDAALSPEDYPRTCQVSDTGHAIVVHVGGQRVFETPAGDDALKESTGIGLLFQKESPFTVDRFEAHPRSIKMPEVLALDAPFLPREVEQKSELSDRFTRDAGPLNVNTSGKAGLAWRREIGKGSFEIMEGGGVRVAADRTRPNPGRTAYTIDWNDPAYADLETEIVPPGMGRGYCERGRGGLILFQDASNYLIVNTWLDDQFKGASISSFPFLNGKEDVYRAVWTNVGQRIRWGEPYRMRVVSDGMHYLVFIDDEPVLYRALSDIYPEARSLRINRVGLAANWEWGNDTGSKFNWFRARKKREVLS